MWARLLIWQRGDFPPKASARCSALPGSEAGWMESWQPPQPPPPYLPLTAARWTVPARRLKLLGFRNSRIYVSVT